MKFKNKYEISNTTYTLQESIKQNMDLNSLDNGIIESLATHVNYLTNTLVNLIELLEKKELLTPLEILDITELAHYYTLESLK